MNSSDRAALIARLRDYDGRHDHDCVNEAADMLEADAQPAAQQEPVAWKTDTSSGKLRFTIGVQTFTIDYDADGEEELQWMEKQLITALSRMAAPQPQRPRLSDRELAEIWDSALDQLDRRDQLRFIARAIEKKVRCEA